jgi:hypothetical protein
MKVCTCYEYGVLADISLIKLGQSALAASLLGKVSQAR